MHIQESGEMYLESIYVLLKENGFVRSVDVAEHMGYSKPSISRAMGLLKKGGFIEVAPDGAITLTETGKAVAEKIYERHTVLSRFLISLGVSPEVAAEDACRLEHAISDASFDAIKAYMTKDKTPVQCELPQFVRTAQKRPYVGNI